MTDGELHRWEFWKGVSGLCYARKRGTSPPVVLKAESYPAVCDRVLAYLACPDTKLRWAMVRMDDVGPPESATITESGVRQGMGVLGRPQESPTVPIIIEPNQDQDGV